MPMIWIWIAVIVIAVIVEAASVQLLSVWFALGGLVALILSIFNVSATIQIIVFAAVSAVSLILFWPLARKLNKKGFEKTNADRYIGKEGIVVEPISNLDAKGQVKVDNQIWTARSAGGEEIAEGAKITVERIEGVKLIVSPINEE